MTGYMERVVLFEVLIMELDSRRLKPFAYGLTASKLRNLEYQFKDLGPRETGIIYFGQLLVRYALIYAREIGGDPHEVSHSIEEYAPRVILLLGKPGERGKVLLQGLLGMGVPIVSLKTDYGLEGHINTSQSIHEMMEKVWKLPIEEEGSLHATHAYMTRNKEKNKLD